MKTYKTTKKIPVLAGMQFDGSSIKTIKNHLHIVGYKLMVFMYDSKQKDCLTNEFEIKRVIKAD